MEAEKKDVEMYSRLLQQNLTEVDPDMAAIIQEEHDRQRRCLNLVASENITSLAVMEATGSCLTNKYADGSAGARFFTACQHIDKVEFLTKKRALQVFQLSPDTWGVNVQAYSGCPANLAVYTGLVGPGGRIMGLDVSDGGHPSHGYQTDTMQSSTSMFFTTMPYKVDPVTGLVDYDQLKCNALLFKPKLIVAGTCSYTRHLDYQKLREVADACGAVLMADMAHIGGLVSAGLTPSPFSSCHVVTTTTHKTLAGPRAAMIFYRKVLDLEEKINHAVLPVLQGGPHNHSIAAVGVAMRQALTPEFKAYQRQVVSNARTLCEALKQRGYTIGSGGTDNHIILVDLTPLGVNAAGVEAVLERMSVTVNKWHAREAGLRMGTPTITARSLQEDSMARVADLLHKGVTLALEVQQTAQSESDIDNIKMKLDTNQSLKSQISVLRDEVEHFMKKFPMPAKAYN